AATKPAATTPAAGASPAATSAAAASPAATSAAAATTPAATGSPAAAASPAAASSPAASTAGSGKTISIAVIAPFTGLTADYGQSLMNGINLALTDGQKLNLVDKNNAINGQSIEFIQQDEACTPELAVNAANKLLGRVVVVMGP